MLQKHLLEVLKRQKSCTLTVISLVSDVSGFLIRLKIDRIFYAGEEVLYSSSTDFIAIKVMTEINMRKFYASKALLEVLDPFKTKVLQNTFSKKG